MAFSEKDSLAQTSEAGRTKTDGGLMSSKLQSSLGSSDSDEEQE